MKKQPGQPMRSTILRLVSHGVALGTLAAILALLVPGRAEAIIIHMKFGQVGVVFDADQAVQVNVSDTWDSVTANIAPVSENVDALESAASRRGCGNGVCNGTETCSTCPADCGVCPPVCGDHTCNGTETCSSCPADCGACPPVCGDGTCNSTETCNSCPFDCGACPPVCGDGTCNGTETCNSCPADCACPPVSVCGDGVCNIDENCGTCSVDCGTCPPCTSDADCVPATCCHPTVCVPNGQAQDCGGACTADCQPFTLDCGQGYCACQNGQCTAFFFPDGPVVTELSSDSARTSPELAAPTNLSALGSQTQIDISWEDNSRGETGFEVHRSPTGAPNSFILLETVGINGTAFSNSGLTLDEHFCYQVRAVRTSTTTYSGFSNIACTTAAPVAIVSFEAVFAGGAHTCALTSGGAAYCWGRGESGQLGVQAPPSTCLTDAGFFSCSMVPVPVGGGFTFEKLAGGGAHTCALTSDGTAYCWGNNAYGQLGDNSTTSRNAPVPVVTGLKFDSIDAGAAHTCAVTSAGAAYCWGRNDRGQLGDGTTTNSAVPVAVTGSLTFQLIAAGGFSIGHTCGLTDPGAAYCWGDNERGQLGTGTSDLDPHALPVPVSGGFVFDGLTAGLGRHSCGFTALGTAYCWGENTFGALGNRSRKDSAVPVAVVGNLSFFQLIAGGFIGHTCGVSDGSAAYCWGENEKGQVGDGTTRDRLAPKAVAGRLEFLSVDAGFRHTCGRASTGTVYCWGSSGAGQLGNNSNSLSTVPAKVFGQP